MVRAMRAAFAFASLMLVFCMSAPAQEKQNDEGVLRFRGMAQGQVNGRRHVIVQAEVPGGRAAQVAVPNQDENRPALDPRKDLMETLKSLKPGDLVKVTLEPGRQMPFIQSAEPYELKPGEDTPNGYVFKSSYDQGAGRNKTPVVELTKFGRTIVVGIATRKNEKGETEPDPDLVAAVNLMKQDDPVWAQINGKVLTAIDLYKDPSQGKLLKLGETEVDGHKVKSADVDQDGKSVTLLVPGKTTGKNWIADSTVLRELQRLRPNTIVEYRVREDGDHLWLREIMPAPKPPAATPEQKKNAIKEKQG
jgi:hypothetical protein